MTRNVGDTWTWLQDYIHLWGTFTVNCEPGRRCRVGMGIFFAGNPRGQQIDFESYVKIFTIGIGAVHVRVIDGKGPCTVQVDPGDVGLIPVYHEDDPLKG